VVQSRLLGIGLLVEAVLARNHCDQEHEWSDSSQHERH
jgi:hypothetical protein